MSKENTTVIISCAGMGTRLGIGMPKALVNVDGKPLIIRQLEMLQDCSDVRIIVGFQADKVIETVKSFRKDVMFAFNYDYRTTGTAASFSKGLTGARTYVVALDGDLLVRPYDLEWVLNAEEEVIAGTTPSTDNPVLMTLDREHRVIEFSRERGQLEWTGLAKMRTDRLTPGTGHVYQMLEPLLPIRAVEIHTKEIDTVNDYENAVKWVRNHYRDAE